MIHEGNLMYYNFKTVTLQWLNNLDLLGKKFTFPSSLFLDLQIPMEICTQTINRNDKLAVNFNSKPNSQRNIFYSEN
jgi:hypothetical protein